MAHRSDSLSLSPGGLDIQSSIPARLESKVQHWQGVEPTHPNVTLIWFGESDLIFQLGQQSKKKKDNLKKSSQQVRVMLSASTTLNTCPSWHRKSTDNWTEAGSAVNVSSLKRPCFTAVAISSAAQSPLGFCTAELKRWNTHRIGVRTVKYHFKAFDSTNREF